MSGYMVQLRSCSGGLDGDRAASTLYLLLDCGSVLLPAMCDQWKSNDVKMVGRIKKKKSVKYLSSSSAELKR